MAPIPCSNIPFPRNPHFYGREVELEKIPYRLGSQTRPAEISHPVKDRDGVTLSCWKVADRLILCPRAATESGPGRILINKETLLTLSQGSTEIAILLNLKEAITNRGHKQNRKFG